MASNDLNENKLEKFHNEIKDERSFRKKMNTLFQEQYKDNIDDILILKEEMFLDQLREGVQLLLEESYTDNCLSDDRLMKLITDNMDEIQKQYNHDFSLVNKTWLAYEKLSKRRTNNEYLLSNFRKHCMHTEDHALHNCCSRGKAKNCHFICVYNADVKKEVKFVICEKCKKVYYSSFIQAYCSKCNKDYYTSLLGPDENPEMLLATWENYHCPQLINEKMKCIKCHGYLYINMKNGILTCLNKKCEFTSKPSKIIWTCSFCDTDFKSEAIPYNPLDILRTQKLVEQAILLKHKAHPKKMPCCRLNVFFTDFFHKIECDGLLYEMELNDKIIVVCEKCNAINYYERFKWTCPKCGKRFRDKNDSINDSNNNTKTYDDNNNTKDNINDINKKNDTANKATKCFSLGKRKYRNSTIYSSVHRNVPKELFFNNTTIKDDKDIITQKEANIIPTSPEISRHRKRYRTRVERELNLGEIKKIMNANEELDINTSKEDSNKRLKRVGFHLDEPEQKSESNISYRKLSRFSVKKKENNESNDEDKAQKGEKEENEDEDTLKEVIGNFPDKKDGEEPENNKMRKSNTNKGVFSRFKADKKAENKDDKDKKEEKEDNKKEKIAEKNLSPRLMWKRRKHIENSNKQNVLDLYSVNNNKKAHEKEEKETEKDKNQEKDSKQNSGGGSWFKRRQEKREREEKEKKEENEEKEEKENNKKEEKNIIIRSPARQHRSKHAKVFACEKEKEKNVYSKNNKKEEENDETEDTKETESKVISKDEENGEDEKKEENKKEKKVTMSKIPGVSEHLYNHINKRIQVILDRCKIPVFNVEDYMFDRKLGEGGYAIIFAVYKMDDESCKEYAMKKIIARTLNEIDKFTKEFELVYSCEHPNIMKIYGLCIRMLDQTTYSLYVLMEISTGDWDSDIKKHLLKKKSYTEKELICILRQLTDALLFLQQKLKISHRDIKPQNVLLFGDGVYKLADFGEAKESKISKEINTLRGTELYMSPALYSGLKNESNDVNHDPYKSDVFSLGFCFIYAAALNFKLLYQLRDVYNSNQMNQILKQQLKKKYSDTFIDILSHMMEIDESLRYDFSHLMEAINTNYDKEGNLKNPDSERKLDSKRGFRKNK